MPYEFAKSKYYSALSSYSMLKGLDRVLVGFSGGADSTLLLTLLSRTEGIEVAAAHLNHGIRGEEADRDERFCIEYCKSLGITIYVRHSNIPAIAALDNLTVEEAARNERYSFFNEISTEHGYNLIATAHNSDDNIETVIFNLARGTSLSGLCGIPPKRDNIIRPLIMLTKDDIIKACKKEGIKYVKDSTNNDTEYTRNYIRHEIIPKLKTINPSVCDSVLSCSSSLRVHKNYIQEISKEYSLSNDRASLSALHDAVLSSVISRELSENGIQYSSVHIGSCIKAIRSDAQHISVSIPKAEFICDRSSVYISNSTESYSNISLVLKRGFNELPGNRAIYVGNSEKDINTLKNIYKLSIQVAVNSDKIDGACFIRYRQSGDTYKLNGMSKKVKKLIQSLKLPSVYTDGIPFICRSNEILYIPHFKPSDGVKINDTDKSIDIYYFYNKELLQ